MKPEIIYVGPIGHYCDYYADGVYISRVDGNIFVEVGAYRR